MVATNEQAWSFYKSPHPLAPRKNPAILLLSPIFNTEVLLVHVFNDVLNLQVTNLSITTLSGRSFNSAE
jgi:hypothetical protein